MTMTITLAQVNDVMDCVSASIVYWRDVTLHTTAYDSSSLPFATIHFTGEGGLDHNVRALWDYL